MTENKRFMIDDAGELIDLNNHQFIDYGDEVCNLLNELHEENSALKIDQEFKNKAYSKLLDSFMDLKKKYQTLKRENKELKIHYNNIREQRNEFYRGAIENANRVGKLKKENEQLKQRNDRQAKRLDNLYRLIEEKDWRTLSDILDDFKRCEEQLQRESGTYCDVE